MFKKQWLAATASSVFAMAAMSGMSATAFANTTTYTVKPGDSYFKIARAQHQPLAVLQAINNAKSSALHPGQTIHLATPYRVKAGDSVWKIARAFHVTEADIIRWNHLANPSFIEVGTTLWLGVSQRNTSSTSSTRKVLGAAEVVPQVRSHVAPAQPAVTGSDVVAYAKQFLGAPYQWGGSSAAGFDCSGLVQAVYSHFNISLPRTAAGQHQAGPAVSKSALLPGDLVFFDTTGSPYSHVGIYVGNGQFLSATSSHGVVLQDLNSPYYWGPRYTGAINPLA